MLGVLLTTNQSLVLNLFDPSVILFGGLFVLFGAAMTLIFLLKERPALSWPLISLLAIIESSLIGILALEFSSASDAFYTIGAIEQISEMFQTHRWLLFQLPLLLVFASIIVLAVYRENIGGRYAREYRAFIISSVIISFFSILIIGLESLI